MVAIRETIPDLHWGIMYNVGVMEDFDSVAVEEGNDGAAELFTVVLRTA